MKTKTFIAILLLISNTGCRVGPKYHAPAPCAPEDWKNSIEQQSCNNEQTEQTLHQPKYRQLCNWWEVFGDETLNNLEKQAVANNPNIQIALARIEEAWAIVGISRSDLYPHINFNPSYSDTGELFKLFLPPSLAISTLPGDVFRVHQYQYFLPINMNYELDLWGKFRQNVDSSIYSAEAQEQACNTALLSLTADVASAYYNARTFDAIIEVLRDNLDLLKQVYEFNLSRFQKGIGNDLIVNTSLVNMTNAESDLEDAIRQRGIQENLIAALLGIPTSEFQLEINPLYGSPPAIPPGIPSTILFQRPDIAEAERNMAAEHAQIGVAFADNFPTLSLTGTIGYLSPDLRQFTRWISRFWSMGGNSNLPIFEGGRIDSNVERTWARFRQASWAYQQTVITAFREVEDALNNLDTEAKQLISLGSSWDTSKKVSTLSLHRYKAGLINQNEVLQNNQAVLTAQLNYVNVSGFQYQSTIQLIKALGGSWKTPDICIDCE